MDSDFSNKTVLITGSSRGIGRAIAQKFAELSIVQADMSDPESVQNMIHTVLGETGRIHVLVNNAGIFEEYPILDLTYEDWQKIWDRTIRTNLMGPANASFCMIQHMKENGGGKIVNVSSRGAFRGEPDAPAYGASKAGLNALSQSLALALAPHNIFVYVVAPGFVKTDRIAPLLSGPRGDAIRAQSPFGRVAYPEEVANTVLFLASEGNGASYLRT
jgi:NAD(P)-dependent dehydrogenase (short-subunit alcohol dehydrogenase family)